MRLKQYTDLGLRTLFLLADRKPEHMSLTKLSETLNCSKEHARKVTHFMRQQEWLGALHGAQGGFFIEDKVYAMSLGEIVRTLEGTQPLIDCTKPLCPLSGRCKLPCVLQKAEDAFFKELDKVTFGEACSQKVSACIHPISFKKDTEVSPEVG